ncbi:TetR/AcrR family transcriptional regulator [Streptomyces sp. NPDC059063]|uniref:TetR/AcrR family transcriptional regulator n=1 Tax=unclassified Streptomyces TaxID=2593676 RepID=UPI003682826B
MARRRAILDAAEALLGKQGYEATTLKAISERAGIPVASIYHYFSDRYEVEAELLERHVRELDARIGATLEAPGPHTLRDTVDAVLDAVCDYFRAHPSCTELWFARRSTTADDPVPAFDRAQAERLHHFLAERGLMCVDTPRHVLRLAFEVGNRLLDIAFRSTPAGDETTIGEARRVITAYLATYAPSGA